MGMTPDERDALRARVDAEPADGRGLLSSVLMAEIDRFCAENERKSRSVLIDALMHTWHISPEDAVRYVDMRPLPTFQLEQGTCRTCDGKGGSFVTGCMDGRWERCAECLGGRKAVRLRLPWAPDGELVATRWPIRAAADTPTSAADSKT